MSPIRVFEDGAALAAAAAAEVARRARSVTGRLFRLGLSGGRGPVELYRRLALDPDMDWRAVEILFADERAAPPHEPESNYWMARKILLEPAGIPPGQVRRMRAEDPDLDAAARDYERWVTAPIDVLLLGVGEDGHTASLFPASRLLDERERRVAAVFDSPKPPPRRLTLTPRALAEARHVMVLASGEAKTRAVAAALEGASPPRVVPARLLRDREWYLDAAAAAGLGVR